jgi:hypothetical protein
MSEEITAETSSHGNPGAAAPSGGKKAAASRPWKAYARKEAFDAIGAETAFAIRTGKEESSAMFNQYGQLIDAETRHLVTTEPKEFQSTVA